MIAALSWTVGPSRPTDPPPSSISSVMPTFATAVRIDTNGPSPSACGSRAAAITCGMPDPRAAGTHRSVV